MSGKDAKIVEAGHTAQANSPILNVHASVCRVDVSGQIEREAVKVHQGLVVLHEIHPVRRDARGGQSGEAKACLREKGTVR